MAKRVTYSDKANGETDKRIMRLLGHNDMDERAAMLRRVMLKVINNELTPRQKEIIMLYYFQDMTLTDIGDRLGISPQAASAAMSRAKLRLFRILQYYV